MASTALYSEPLAREVIIRYMEVHPRDKERITGNSNSKASHQLNLSSGRSALILIASCRSGGLSVSWSNTSSVCFREEPCIAFTFAKVEHTNNTNRFSVSMENELEPKAN